MTNLLFLITEVSGLKDHYIKTKKGSPRMLKLRSRLKLFFISFLDRFKSTEKIFSDIYRKNLWGGKKGEFCSGDGSSNPSVIEPYIKKLVEISTEQDFINSTCVDLGCGDFQIGKKIHGLFSKYIGVDIVPDLISHNKRTHCERNVDFLCKDIISDALPDGDICILRQVLQHLSNNQIQKIIKKISKYKICIITEHIPHEKYIYNANIDKTTGGSIRLFNKSGIYLWLPPFNLPQSRIKSILKVPSPSIGGNPESGFIETFIYTP